MELWDEYRADGTKTGEKHERGKLLPDGVFHLVCETLLRHRDGTYLVMRRDEHKPIQPGLWEATAGGSALAGEDALTGALRELKEETGLTGENPRFLYRIVSEKTHAIYVGYLCETACDKNAVVLQKTETIAYQWLEKDELLHLMQSDHYVLHQRNRLMSVFFEV